MSIPVELPTLASVASQFGPAAFFVTTGDDGRAHLSHVAVTWVADMLRVDIGRSGARNSAKRPATVLLWPPIEPGGYSLIVDVIAQACGDHALLTPERAVLHRPALPVGDAPVDGGASGGAESVVGA